MKWKVLLAVLCVCLANGKQAYGEQMEPVNFSNFLTVCDGCLANGLTFAYVVPAWKRLVIEYVSVEVENLADGDSMDVSISTTVDETQVEHYLGVAQPINRSKIDGASHPNRMVSKKVKIYADPETPVSLGASRLSRVGKAWVRYSFSGYLVNTRENLSPPDAVKATDGAFTGRVRVTFNATPGATVYRIFRCPDISNNCGLPIGYSKIGSFDDTGGTPGTVYQYRVRACTPTACGGLSVPDAGHRAL